MSEQHTTSSFSNSDGFARPSRLVVALRAGAGRLCRTVAAPLRPRRTQAVSASPQRAPCSTTAPAALRARGADVAGLAFVGVRSVPNDVGVVSRMMGVLVLCATMGAGGCQRDAVDHDTVDSGTTPGGEGESGDAGSDAGRPDPTDAGDDGPDDAGDLVDAGDDHDAGSDVDAGPELSGCAADLQALADRGGPGALVRARGNQLLPDCIGTRHQVWSGVERVVFVGDSVTVGTPPADITSIATIGNSVTDIVTDVDKSYRSLFSDVLAARFGLDRPGFVWRGWNPAAQGEALQRSSGDFWNCARWGSKTRDLDGQIDNCFPDSERNRKTMAVFTSGGNDLVDIVKLIAHGETPDAVWARAQETVDNLDEAIARLKDTANFPAGTLVLFATPYEFTDWSGDISSCAAAQASGVSPVTSPEGIALLKDVLDWLTVSYLGVAEEQGADVAFLLEVMCGHGFHRDDATLPCYRGPGAERFLDLTCIHPNVRGHQELVDRFSALVGAH